MISGSVGKPSPSPSPSRGSTTARNRTASEKMLHASDPKPKIMFTGVVDEAAEKVCKCVKYHVFQFEGK